MPNIRDGMTAVATNTGRLIEGRTHRQSHKNLCTEISVRGLSRPGTGGRVTLAAVPTFQMPIDRSSCDSEKTGGGVLVPSGVLQSDVDGFTLQIAEWRPHSERQ